MLVVATRSHCWKIYRHGCTLRLSLGGMHISTVIAGGIITFDSKVGFTTRPCLYNSRQDHLLRSHVHNFLETSKSAEKRRERKCSRCEKNPPILVSTTRHCLLTQQSLRKHLEIRQESRRNSSCSKPEVLQRHLQDRGNGIQLWFRRYHVDEHVLYTALSDNDNDNDNDNTHWRWIQRALSIWPCGHEWWGHDLSKMHRKSGLVLSAIGWGKSEETIREDSMFRSVQRSHSEKKTEGCDKFGSVFINLSNSC